METQARALFAAYADLTNKAIQGDEPDAAAFQSCYADYAVGSSPVGVVGGDNGALAAIFPQMIGRYRAIGGTAFTLAGLRVDSIDDVHAVAAVDWSFSYEKDGKSGSIPFTNLYYLTFAGGDPKIFAFITPNEEEAIKAHGLV